MRKAVFTALEIRDEAEILRGLDSGELEARILAGERAQASAPPDVSSTLRLTAQAEADALRQSADAQAQHDDTDAASAKSLAGQLAVERRRLEAASARYEQWAAGTRDTREAAAKARTELQHRGYAQPQGEPQAQPSDQLQTMEGWWREFEADLQAVERAIARQHQAAIDSRQPWPPQRAPELEQLSVFAPEPVPTPTGPEGKPAHAQPGHDDQAAQLDELLAQADQAAQRLAAQRGERQATREYAARLEREAQAQPEAERQAEVRDGAEMEL
jgi:hypothetical protein